MVSPSPSSSVSMSTLGSPRSSKTDAFRPKLPSDPFAGLETSTNWLVNNEELERMLSTERSAQNVILILGDPSRSDMEALTEASSLKDSLLLIVTSSPLQHLVPSSETSPYVHVLRLLSPMALQDPGAQNLLSVFQRAEVVARSWRKAPGKFNKRGQLCEGQPGGPFTVAEECGFSPKQDNTSNNTLSNSTRAINSTAPKSINNKSVSRPGMLRFTRETSDSGGKAFDALINFLPSSFNDKSILKHIILVTTLSQTFLSSPTPNRLRSPFRTSHSQPSSRSPSPSFGKTRNSSSISSFSRRFSSLLTSSDISLSERNVRQADATVVTVTSDMRSRSSRFSARAYSSSHSVPIMSIKSANVASGLELKPTRSHIVHVLPSSVQTSLQASRSSTRSSLGTLNQPPSRQVEKIGKSKLLQSIEQFLRSYTNPYPSGRGTNLSSTSLNSSSPDSPFSSTSSTSGSDFDLTNDLTTRQPRNIPEKPAAYVVSGDMLCHKPATAKHNSPAVVEMLLLGLLDPTHSSSSCLHDGNGNSTVSSPLLDFVTATTPKVWIGHPDDVVLKAARTSSIIATGSGFAVQEENTRTSKRGSTGGLEEENGDAHANDAWRRQHEGGESSISSSTSRREASSSNASRSSTTSYGDESPSTSTSGVDDFGSTGAVQRVEVKSRNSRPSLAARMREMTGGWKIWKSVSI